MDVAFLALGISMAKKLLNIPVTKAMADCCQFEAAHCKIKIGLLYLTKIFN